MIFASINSSLASSLFWTAFWAGIGGLLVLLGLCLEKKADKKIYRNVSDLRRQKSISEFGWGILIAGIVVEIVTACVAAVSGNIEMKQIKINEANNDPLNQPVSDVSAVVRIKLAGTNFIELSSRDSSWIADLNIWQDEAWISEQFKKKTPITIGLNEFGSFMAGKDDVSRVDYSHMFASQKNGYMEREIAHGYILHFHTDESDGLVPFVPVFRTTPIKVRSIIDGVKSLRINADFIPNDAELLGGDAEILINGNIRMDFDILPQKAFPPPIGLGRVGNPGFTMIATNATLKNLPTWMR